MLPSPLVHRLGGVIELTCPHGVGHPSLALMEAQGRVPRPGDGIHGCDGCCGTEAWRASEADAVAAAKQPRTP